MCNASQPLELRAVVKTVGCSGRPQASYMIRRKRARKKLGTNRANGEAVLL